MQTIPIFGSPSDVMARIGGPGTFIRGRLRTIRVTKVGPDEMTPFEIRQALVGLEIQIVFDHKQFPDIPTGTVVASCDAVIEALDKVNPNAATRLHSLVGREGLYFFEPGTYVFT